jgi:hypothetical protein
MDGRTAAGMAEIPFWPEKMNHNNGFSKIRDYQTICREND